MGSPRTRSRWRLRLSTVGAVAPASPKPWARTSPIVRTFLHDGLDEDLQDGTLAHDGTDRGDSEPGETRLRPRVRPDHLAGGDDATHVSSMLSQTKTQIVGFMELQVGSLAVQVPIRSAEPLPKVDGPAMPLASFEVEGDSYAILIRGDSSSKAVERAMGDAAKEAVAHLSRKLLN